MKTFTAFLSIFLLSNLCSCTNRASGRSETTEPEGLLVDGKKQGEWKTYYTASRRLCTIENYVNDTLNGVSLTYLEDGMPYTKAHYKGGKLVDSFIHYYSNGQPNFETWYDSNSRKQGLFKLYYKDGMVKQVGHNKDGHMEGEWKLFYPNGQLQTIEFYRNRKKEGTWKYYNEEGKLLREEHYRDDSLLAN